MKQVNLLILFLAAMLLAFVSCEKDELSEEEAIELINDLDDQEYMMQDSVNNSVVFTVTIVDATTDVVLKSANETNGLPNLRVTASQEGEIMVDSTNQSGMVVFDNLRLGSVALSIEGDGYTNVDMVAGINQNGYYSVIVPVLSTLNENKGTIKGNVTFQGDLTNYEKEQAEDAKVFALLDPNCAFANNLTTAPGINQVVYKGLTDTTTTGTDGAYSMKLPADAVGDVEYRVFVEDFVYEQNILMNTVNGQSTIGEGNTSQSIATTFSSSLSGVSPIHNVDGVYATITEPTGKFVAAEATADIIEENALSSVNVTSNGSGYENGSYTLTVPGTEQAAQVEVNVSDNRVAYVDVINSGANIDANNLDLSFEQEEFTGEVASVDGVGGITSITVQADDEGRYLSKNAQISISSTYGSGANIAIDNWVSYAEGYGLASYSFNIGSAGQNYAVGDEITITINEGQEATAELNKTSGRVSAIEVTNTGSGYAKNTSFEAELTGGGGKDAEATAYTDGEGRVQYILVTNPGSGYTYAPNVEIPSFNEDIEVSDVVFDSDGMISDIIIATNEVYVQEPAITFYNQATGEEINDIEFEINLAGTALSIDVTDPGSGYTEGNYPATSELPDPETSVKFVNGGTTVHHIHLGTGKRTIEN